jgi:hypothetical protein
MLKKISLDAWLDKLSPNCCEILILCLSEVKKDGYNTKTSPDSKAFKHRKQLLSGDLVAIWRFGREFAKSS